MEESLGRKLLVMSGCVSSLVFQSTSTIAPLNHRDLIHLLAALEGLPKCFEVYLPCSQAPPFRNLLGWIRMEDQRYDLTISDREEVLDQWTD